MAQERSSFVGAGDDQERLLDEATAAVKEQAYYMKRAIDNDNLRESLKHASNLICELRTSLLSPKNYYELYMQVFQEMQHLATFFGDKSRHGRKMSDLYESVQHAGNILPRLYLLATVGSSYIKSKEAPAKEILKDLNELSKGVQHPMRGLFLRYYLSQMVKDKLPDTGTEFEGEGGDITDAFDFIFSNFCESNKLWVRMNTQGPQKEKSKREKERHDLRVLVGANLVRLSQLEGMTVEYYSTVALPRILEHVISVKDTMAQQYLFESMIQVFPDEFHIRTLELVLAAYTKAVPSVDMKPIMVTLMNRLAAYLSNEETAGIGTTEDIFALFRTHLQAILERSMEPSTNGVGAASAGVLDISAPMEVQAAFMQFTISLYPDKLHYVDLILGSTAEVLRKYFERSNDPKGKLSSPGAEKVVELLACPMKTLSLALLEMEHCATLLSYLNFQTRKQVALSFVNAVVDGDRALTSVEAVACLFKFLAPLLKDEEDTPSDEGQDKEAFAQEQQQVCKLVHQIRVTDTDLEFQILSKMRSYFGEGGPKRMAHTLQPVCYVAGGLVSKIQAGERKRVEEEDDSPPPAVTLKKVFQFMHKTTTALGPAGPQAALRLWLVSATLADQVERASGNAGSYEPICFEFLTQALIVFEEEISDSTKQFQEIFTLVGTMGTMTCLAQENWDTVSQKVAQHAARLLKKPMQCRAVATCSHLFWCDARHDGARVLECLKKCLNIVHTAFQTDSKQVILWVEMLEKYIYYYEVGCKDVTAEYVQNLLNLCKEYVGHTLQDASAASEARVAKAQLESCVSHLRQQRNSSEAEVAARFAEISLESPEGGNPL